MQQEHLTDWQPTKLRTVVVRVVTRVVLTACITAIALVGIRGSNALASNSITILPNSSVINTQIENPTRLVQFEQPSPKAAPEIVVYRSPECSCCGGWNAHLKAQGFKLKDFTTTNIEAVKQNYNVPDELVSCHTAIVDGYIIEGHVPAVDIKRLLREQQNVAGLSVPQMPIGTPGMEIGKQKDPFSVLSFNQKGKVAVFSHYPSS